MKRKPAKRALQIAPKPSTRLADGSFMLNKPLARTMIDSPTCPAGVRIFKDSPERVAFQIRTTGRTGGRGSKPRDAFSHVSLDRGDISAIVLELLALQRLLAEPEGAL